jgi:hypothetical protein
MATCRIIETGVTPEEYERVREAVGAADQLPEGSTLHVAAVGEDGKMRIFEVWETRQQAEDFGEKVRDARERLGVGEEGSRPQLQYLEVHTDRRA